MKPIELFIDVIPMGKPRMTQRDKWLNPPRECVARYWAMKDVIGLSANSQGAKLMTSATVAHFVFILPRPKSVSKKVEHHIVKPDLDNLVKAAKDSLNSVCWVDDALICELYASKEYGNKPGILIQYAEVE